MGWMKHRMPINVDGVLVSPFAVARVTLCVFEIRIPNSEFRFQSSVSEVGLGVGLMVSPVWIRGKVL